MKNLKNNLIDFIFLSAAGLLLLFLIIPWPFPQIEVKSSSEPFVKKIFNYCISDPVIKKIDFTAKVRQTTKRSVAGCAFLFGVRPPKSGGNAPDVKAAPQNTGPQNAEWITYIGLIATPEGEKKYYFKDTRSSRIIKVALGETAGGWTLAGMSDSGFTLKNDGKTYLVEK